MRYRRSPDGTASNRKDLQDSCRRRWNSMIWATMAVVPLLLLEVGRPRVAPSLGSHVTLLCSLLKNIVLQPHIS